MQRNTTSELMKKLSGTFVELNVNESTSENLTWTKGFNWHESLPNSMYLHYQHQHGKAEFAISGNKETIDNIYVIIKDRAMFDMLMTKLQAAGISAVERQSFCVNENGFEFDINNPSIEQTTIFIDDLNIIYPLSSSIKKPIEQYVNEIKGHAKVSSSNSDVRLERLTLVIENLSTRIEKIEEQLEQLDVKKSNRY